MICPTPQKNQSALEIVRTQHKRIQGIEKYRESFMILTDQNIEEHLIATMSPTTTSMSGSYNSK